MPRLPAAIVPFTAAAWRRRQRRLCCDPAGRGATKESGTVLAVLVEHDADRDEQEFSGRLATWCRTYNGGQAGQIWALDPSGFLRLFAISPNALIFP